MSGCCAAAVCFLLVLHPGSPAWGHTLCLHSSAPCGSAAFVGSQLHPREQCLSTCISAFLSQLPGAHPSCRERLGGGRGDGGGSDEEAAGEDLGEAPCAGGAVPCLETEGGPGVLRDDLCLPHQHVALAEKMTAHARPPLLALAGWVRTGRGVLASSETLSSGLLFALWALKNLCPSGLDDSEGVRSCCEELRSPKSLVAGTGGVCPVLLPSGCWRRCKPKALGVCARGVLLQS